MASIIDRRLRKLESGSGDDGVGFVINQRYEGQPFAEAWREQHGDTSISQGRAFMSMPDVCATTEEWLATCAPR
jgi:hypothetical protein